MLPTEASNGSDEGGIVGHALVLMNVRESRLHSLVSDCRASHIRLSLDVLAPASLDEADALVTAGKILAVYGFWFQ